MVKTALLLIITLFALSCNRNDDVNNNNQDPENIVSVMVAEKEIYRPSISFTGTIKPYREANLGTAIPGKVEKLHYKEGEHVNKGSLIAQLSGEATAMARYEYETLEKDYQRLARLKEKGSTTQQDYDHVKAKFKAAESRYEFFKNNSEIRAPFTGTIVEYLVNEGETFLFSPGLEPGYSHASGIVRLMQMNPVKVAVDISENLIPKLNSITKIHISTDAYPNQHFDGEITFISPVLSSASRTTTAEITVNNPEDKLMPGMFARVKLEMAADSLVFIPRHAIADRKERKGYVWVIQKGLSHQQQVNIIEEHSGKFAVIGINEGDSVVVSGIHRLREDMKVKVSGD